MSPDSFTDRQASQWLARLDSGEMSEQDQLAMREWMACDARHREAVSRMDGAWRATDFLATLSEQDRCRLLGGLDGHVGSGSVAGTTGGAASGASHANVWITRVIAVAAAVLVAVIGLFVVRQAAPGEVYRTNVGEQRKLVLADGSAVTLNTGSMLRVSYSPTARSLTLERGEAFFEVAADRSRPFRVSVDGREVRALGTAFGVRRDGRDFDLIVTEGTVEVAKDAQSRSQPHAQFERLRVTRGEVARVPHDDRPVILAAAEKPSLAWREGLLEFNGETLERVVREFGRYTHRQILFADEGVKALRLGGVFKAGDVEALTSAVDLMLPVKVTRITPYVIVLSMEASAD